MAESDGGISIGAVGMSGASTLIIRPCEAEEKRRAGSILANLEKSMPAGNDPGKLNFPLRSRGYWNYGRLEWFPALP